MLTTHCDRRCTFSKSNVYFIALVVIILSFHTIKQSFSTVLYFCYWNVKFLLFLKKHLNKKLIMVKKYTLIVIIINANTLVNVYYNVMYT